MTHSSCLSRLLMALLIASSTSIAGAPASAETSMAAGGSFVWLSDIHFDPFYAPSTRDEAKITAMLEQLVDRPSSGSPTWKDHTTWAAVFAASSLQNVYNIRGADANDAVLQEVLRQAAAKHPAPDFIVLTGDLLGHDFGADYTAVAPSGMNTATAYITFVAQTLKYLAQSIRGAFPDPPIIATLGNNDAYCGDYDLHLDVDLGSQQSFDFLTDTSNTFLDYFLPDLKQPENQAKKAKFLETFLRGGYYSLPVPNGGGSRFLVVNSIPFMAKYPCEECSCDTGDSECKKCGAACGSFELTKGPCAASPIIDADAQMSWLTHEADAPSSAWVVAHVPPGKGCWSTSPSWTSTYLDPFRDLFLSSPPTRVAGTLAAHSHMASFKLVRDDDDNAVSFVLQSPSIGSNHSNNPTFGILTHDPSTLEITGYTVWYLDLSHPSTYWGHYQFAGLPGSVTTQTLASLYTQLGDTSSSDWGTFQADYGARAPICTATRKNGCVDLGALSQTNLACLDSLE